MIEKARDWVSTLISKTRRRAILTCAHEKLKTKTTHEFDIACYELQFFILGFGNAFPEILCRNESGRSPSTRRLTMPRPLIKNLNPP